MDGIASNGAGAPSAEPDAPGKLAAFGAALAEHAWMAALLAAPLYLNLHSQRVFEEDKVPLVRSLCLLVFLGLAIWVAERNGRATARRGSLWRMPLVPPVVAFATVYAGATLASTSPLTSLLGGYHRLQGAYTFASYLALFLAPIVLGVDLRRAERIVSVALLASLPVSLYALVQYSGYDPMPWGATFGSRVYSTTGNPIFLGAYLVMVVPLAIGRIFQRARSRWTSALGYLALLTLQIVALTLSQSRGPFVAVGAGMAAFGLAWTALRARRRVLLLACAAVVSMAVVATVVASRTSELRLQGIERLLDVANAEEGSGKVRSLIWQASSNLIHQSDLARVLIGYGPESELTALTPFYPPELGQYESRRTIPDRAHNEAIDATVATGVLGCAAEFTLFIAVFAHLLGALGLIRGNRERTGFTLLLAGAGIAGVLIPYWADGSLRFSGLGLHAGVVGALLVFLAGRALLRPAVAARRDATGDLLLLGLLGAVAGHLLEIGLGIPVAAPRVYFWTYAGLVAALAAGHREESESSARELPAGVAMASIAAIALVILTVDSYTPSAKRSSMLLLLLAVGVPTWIGGALLLQRWTGGWRQRLRVGGTYVATTLLPWISFAALLVWWLNWQPALSGDTAEFVVRFGRHVAGTSTLVYAAIAALVVAGAAFAATAARDVPAPFMRSAPRAALYALLAAAAFALIAAQNLSVSRADVLSKQATFYEGRGRFDLAAALVREAIRLRPSVDRYYSDLGREYTEDGRATWASDPGRGRELFLQADGALRQARKTLPLLFDHTRNLARLHRAWMDLVTDPSESAEHLARADALYAEASAIAPTSAPILNERALMHFSKGDHRRARELLDRSAGIDPRYPTTFWLRANVSAAQEDFEGALADYDRALAIEPGLAAALTGKGGVLARLGRIDEAIEANRQLLRRQPRDLIGRRNLAFLFREKGDVQNALQWARRAREVAPAAEKPALDAFVAELQQSAKQQGTGDAP